MPPLPGVAEDSAVSAQLCGPPARRPALIRRLNMRRNSRPLLATAGAALTAVLLIAGGLLLWGSAYVHNTVQGQLAAQQINFPPASAFAHAKAGTEITPSMIPSVSQY